MDEYRIKNKSARLACILYCSIPCLKLNLVRFGLSNLGLHLIGNDALVPLVNFFLPENPIAPSYRLLPLLRVT